MGRINETISIFNTTIRTLLATVVVGGLGYGGWVGYQKYYDTERREKAFQEAQKELAVLRQDVQAKQQQIDKLETAMKLLKVNHRLAKITVLEVGQYADGQRFSKVNFVEIDDHGDPIGEPRDFSLRGDEFWVDGLVVKFKDEYIEKADLIRGTSLFSFRSIFGNDDGPRNGYPLDDVGARPLVYARGSAMSDFEKQIWDDFWTIAMDTGRQNELGIRTMHGQANYQKAVEGKTFYVELRASDGAGLRLLDQPPAPPNGKRVL